MSKTKPQRITITVEDAEIAWDEILAAVKVDYDDSMTESPWDSCDGWEHTADKLRYGPEHDDMRNSMRFVIANHGAVWLTLNVEKASICTWDYFHAQGASKQVAHELAAMHLRNAYNQLHKWYANGWDWYYVHAELKGCQAGIGGVDDYKYAAGECSDDIARELAGELEAAGYIITDKPSRAPYRPQLANYKHSKRIHAFDVDGR